MPGRGHVDALKVTGLMVALAGVLLGVGLVEWPGLMVPITLEAIVLGGISWLAFIRPGSPDDRGTLVRLFWLALAVRALVFVGVHFGFEPYFFAPDAIGYERAGRQLSEAWQGIGSGGRGGDRSLVGAGLYGYLNGVVHYLLGESAYALSVLNAFAGVWTVLLVYRLGKHLFESRIGMIAGVVTAVFPSMVLWSVLNIRDSLSVFFVTVLVFAAVRSVDELGPGRILLLLAGIAALTAFRDYMGFLVGAGLLLGYLAVTRPGRIPRTMATGMVTVTVLAFLAVQLDFLSRVNPESPLSTVQQLREGLQQGATSAFGVGEETLSARDAILYLPVGLAVLLFAPFPWSLETPLQAAAAPETFLWYPLFALAAYGLYRAPKHGALENWIPISVLAVVVVCYALVEGNFGTAYRHRAQIMPLFFVYSAVGVRAIKAHLLENPRSGLARRVGSARSSAGRRGRGA